MNKSTALHIYNIATSQHNLMSTTYCEVLYVQFQISYSVLSIISALVAIAIALKSSTTFAIFGCVQRNATRWSLALSCRISVAIDRFYKGNGYMYLQCKYCSKVYAQCFHCQGKELVELWVLIMSFGRSGSSAFWKMRFWLKSLNFSSHYPRFRSQS